MLSITPATNAQQAQDYFTRHMSADYYLRDAVEFAGQWHGRGTELLGLSGQVDKESYFRLCDNLNPETGHQLTPRTKIERRVTYDFTFNAPKSVTLAYELGGDDRIPGKFRSAVTETMGEMEDAMRVRVRTNGSREDRLSANWCWAEFIHRTARPVTGDDGVSLPDPSLHTHAVAINASYDPVENRWKAGEFSHLVRDKGYYQAAFHSRLAEKLSGLGYGIERDGKSFRLAGIDRATCEEFSRRTKIIEAEAKRRGITDAKTKGKLGQWTREAKPEKQLGIAELRKVWKERISEGERKAIVNSRRGQKTSSMDAKQAMDFALSHCFERESTLTRKNLLKTALIQSFGKASVADIHGAAERAPLLQEDFKGQCYVTTKDVLQEERDIVNFVRVGKATRNKLGGTNPVVRDEGLSAEQRAAAELILNSRDRVTSLKGGAGVGKTRMMLSTVAAIEATGKQVFAFAPSAEASRGVLRSEGFENAETVERLLIDPEMQKQVKNQVLLIDEAGLLSVRDMKRLFDVAEKQNARVILSGDTNQHYAVQRGDALRILEKDAGLKSAVLKTIRRQTNESYRTAVAAIADGERVGKDGRTGLEAGIETLDKMGAIIETQGQERYRQIARDYANVTRERKANGESKSALVIAPTHAEIRHVTGAIRETLKASGRLGAKEREFATLRQRNLTEAERSVAASYAPGEIVQFHQNAKGFKRAERVTVSAAGTDGVTVARADGSKTSLPLNEAKKFQVYETERLALSEGDTLRITQNGFTAETRAGVNARGKNRLNNGAVYQVEGFTRQGDINLSNGFVLPKNYGGFTHGYAVTSPASQGKTVDVPLVALGSESLAAMHREQFYVSVSRGREAVRIYTDDKAAMLDAVRGSSARLSASELIQEKQVGPRPKPGTAERLVERARQTYYKLRERLAAHDLVRAYQSQQQRKDMHHGRH